MVATYKDSLVSLSELYTGDWILLVSPLVYYTPFFNNKNGYILFSSSDY